MLHTSYYLTGNDTGLSSVVSFLKDSQEVLAISSDYTELWSRLSQVDKSDFMIIFKEKNFRVRRNIILDENKVFFLREVLAPPDKLSRLGFSFEIQKKLLLSQKEGGLILVTGEPGSGKSTTASCIVVERLNYTGGVSYTLEDPIEFNFSEVVKSGFCMQVPIDEDKDFIHYIRGALRSYPAGSCQKILFIGEIRDGKTAVEALKASANGLLVISTLHGNDISSSIERIISLASEESSRKESLSLLSLGLRFCLHQRINSSNTIDINVLEANSKVKGAIINDKVYMLTTEIQNQNP